MCPNNYYRLLKIKVAVAIALFFSYMKNTVLQIKSIHSASEINPLTMEGECVPWQLTEKQSHVAHFLYRVTNEKQYQMCL